MKTYSRLWMRWIQLSLSGACAVICPKIGTPFTSFSQEADHLSGHHCQILALVIGVFRCQASDFPDMDLEGNSQLFFGINRSQQ